MATTREELHALIDRLPEEELEYWSGVLKKSVAKPNFEKDKWHAQMRQLRAELYAKYGKFSDSADVLKEIREERLNDLMGGE